jgi:CubicO group peptidase (beta-lactamase class C family)
MTWPGLGRALTLARATPAEAAQFSPLPAVYTYREPEPAQDGWRIARASDTGMDEDKLAALVQEIASSDPASKRPVLIHSLLIARHGRLILDEYFHGYDREQPHDLRSAGKTFTSVLLGALMHDGVSIGPDARIADYLAPSTNPDPRKSAITLAQLMTHTSGLACDDNDDASPGNEETMQSQQAQPDWRKYIINLPMAHDPGTRYAYCSGGINLAGAALAAASHTAMPELFDREIARKLQWGPYYWNLMPNGEGYLGGGAYVRPRDLLKLGQAYLDGGVWNGARIADEPWVAQSTASRVVINPQTTGLTPDNFSNVYIPGEDGYAWHLKTFTVAGHSYAAYGAGGNGGQLLIVIPALDMVIAFTGGNYGQGGIWSKWRDEIVPNESFPR